MCPCAQDTPNCLPVRGLELYDLPLSATADGSRVQLGGAPAPPASGAN